TFSEDLTSPLIVVNGPAGADTGLYFYCLRNVGSQTVSVTALAENLTDIELDCTGDESAYDDSCGSGGGELGDFVKIEHTRFDCMSPAVPTMSDVYLLRDTSTTPASLGSLDPGQTSCFGVRILQSSATEAQRQAAQTDRLTWRFAWTGQV